MCQKCGHKSGLWVLHEIVNKTYAENMKKIVGAVWELPARNPQTTFAPTFLTHIIARIDGVSY